jgi:hypothetical protein
MKNKELNSILYDYCRLNRCRDVKNFLSRYPELDIMQDGGDLFKLAIMHNYYGVLDWNTIKRPKCRETIIP